MRCDFTDMMTSVKYDQQYTTNKETTGCLLSIVKDGRLSMMSEFQISNWR